MCTTNARSTVKIVKPAATTGRAKKKPAAPYERVLDREARRPYGQDARVNALYRCFLGCIFGPSLLAPVGDDLVLAHAALDVLWRLVCVCGTMREEWLEYHGECLREHLAKGPMVVYQITTERESDELRCRARALDAFGPKVFTRLTECLHHESMLHDARHNLSLRGLHPRITCALVAVFGVSGLLRMAYAPCDDGEDEEGVKADVDLLRGFILRAKELLLTAERATTRLARPHACGMKGCPACAGMRRGGV